ncbi:MAG: amino acid-binding protein [Deltaproteobacteria bacterium HGW-Deltaproteobacteria-11]|nr:MAG: amino acid-binding protein [Deltaproteobacteria bacterium HGW-Deltaproteobacteria-11]
MAVLQISIQLDNVPGALTRLIDILDKEGISVKAISAASTEEVSTLRLVVNDPDKAVTVLKSFNFKYAIYPVIAVEVPCHPGGMNAVVKPLSDGSVNIHYIYTTIERLGKETILILGVDKIDEATAILKQHWINFVGDRIYTL